MCNKQYKRLSCARTRRFSGSSSRLSSKPSLRCSRKRTMTGFRGKERSLLVASRGISAAERTSSQKNERDRGNGRGTDEGRTTSLIKYLQPFPGDVKYDSCFLHLSGNGGPGYLSADEATGLKIIPPLLGDSSSRRYARLQPP